MAAAPGQRPGPVCVGVRHEAQLEERLGWSAWGQSVSKQRTSTWSSSIGHLWSFLSRLCIGGNSFGLARRERTEGAESRGERPDRRLVPQLLRG